ncbi:MAG: immune inhibitor A domain-containing protein [Roseiflexaceae bacterium]
MSHRRRNIRLSGLLALIVALSLLVPAAFAAPAARPSVKGDKDNITFSDDLKHPLGERQRMLRQLGLQAKLRGTATGKVHEVGKGKYVELERESTDKIFVVIAEFGDTRHAAYPDLNEDGMPASDALTFEGPQHNKIPKPNRKNDNTTLWQADYNTAHYEDMYFNRMAKYYQSQSSGRYSVEGDVTEWVKVPFNEARYGRDFCGSNVCNNTWFLIRDALAFWVQDQLATGKTLAEVTEYLQTFDEWDRYDFDGDGVFDEPDGYIDHFQIVHAGGDQAAGDPQQGSDAIWSHRWNASLNPFGTSGPVDLGQFGGIEAGQGGVSSGLTIPANPTGVWVWDYTIQPENGGLGVFAHEFGHDLGLPDLYDTSGNTGGAENSTGFWTLMSSGANIGDGGRDGTGDDPTDMGAWEKFQLGWLGCDTCPGGKFYKVVPYGEAAQFKLGPANSATNEVQAVFALLPDKQVDLDLGAPYAGSNFYYSSSGDNLDNIMYKAVTLPAGASLTAKVRYQIELDWDYAYVVVSTDGGATWISVPTNLSTDTDPNGQNFGYGITGDSAGNWVDLTADLSAYTGDLLVGFRYWTDGAAVEPGFMIDEISIAGGPVDGAEADAGWTFSPAEGGFRVSTGTETSFYFNAYVGENRGYRGYDTSLRTAYNYGFLNARPDWVENFRYQDGLLISYWDDSFSDNNVGDHPGGGLILPVDAHPQPLHWSDGTLARPRIQSYDSTFNRDRTEAITLHKDSVKTRFPSLPAVRVFDDLQTWWYASDSHSAESHGRYQVGWNGVDVPKTGTQIRVKNTSLHGFYMDIEVGPSN